MLCGALDFGLSAPLNFHHYNILKNSELTINTGMLIVYKTKLPERFTISLILP